MGADFIQKAARAFKRTWDRGRVQLATADLFTREPNSVARTIAGDIVDDARLDEGERLTVELNDQGLVGRRGLRQVLRFDDPPDEILRAVQASCGVALGRVEHVHEVAHVAEVSLC